MSKILIHGGTIIDGSGADAFPGDIITENERIADIAPAGSVDAATFDGVAIDARGKLVTPGFIDAHAHSDAYLVLEPDAPSKLSQGITTEINGQCGGSVAPRYGEARLSGDWASLLGERLTWRSLAEYRRILEQNKPAINTVQFIGHNTLRSSTVGYAARSATADEMRRMIKLLEQSLDEGGWGLTTGLIYQPGRHSTPEEVEQLARATAQRGGFYATHIRSEGDNLLESVDEVLNLVRKTGIRAEISHLKTSGQRNWHKIDDLLNKVGGAVRNGELLGSDRYPYCAAGTDLDIVFPDWAQDGGIPEEMKRLANPQLRLKIINEINTSERDWSTVRIGGTWHANSKRFSGRNVDECARETGVSVGEFICRILEADECRTGGFFFGMSEKNLRLILAQPWIVPGSDASLRAPWGALGADHPHPRAYGTMPEFFRLLTQDSAIAVSRENAIARMTSIPARRFGIKGRGILTKGAFADIAVWNEKEFKSTSTYSQPHAFAEGMESVIVNGNVAYRHGKFSSVRNGKFLERNSL